jgi:toxin ParE1/3/4
VRRRRVVFSPEARDDLLRLYDYIANNAGPPRAIAYVERIEAYCRRFEVAAERGTRRDDIRPGLRIVGFERRVTIAFHADVRTATIDRILYGGRDLGRAFGASEDDV